MKLLGDRAPAGDGRTLSVHAEHSPAGDRRGSSGQDGRARGGEAARGGGGSGGGDQTQRPERANASPADPRISPAASQQSVAAREGGTLRDGRGPSGGGSGARGGESRGGGGGGGDGLPRRREEAQGSGVGEAGRHARGTFPGAPSQHGGVASPSALPPASPASGRHDSLRTVRDHAARQAPAGDYRAAREEKGARGGEGARGEGARGEGARGEGARGEGARGEGARGEGARGGGGSGGDDGLKRQRREEARGSDVGEAGVDEAPLRAPPPLDSRALMDRLKRCKNVEELGQLAEPVETFNMLHCLAALRTTRALCSWCADRMTEDTTRVVQLVLGRLKEVAGELDQADLKFTLGVANRLGVTPRVEVLDAILARALELATDLPPDGSGALWAASLLAECTTLKVGAESEVMVTLLACSRAEPPSSEKGRVKPLGALEVS
ncbi:hypothetical protein T484DRAFT_1862517, partial [Baffinella frigidus]